MRVLLVDPHEPSRIAVRVALNVLGHACVDVANEREALAAMRTFRPNAIAYAPNSASPQRFCNAAERFVSAVVVVAITLDDAPVEAGNIHGRLVKPFDPRELEQLLRGDAA